MGPVIATESLTKKYKSKVVVNRLDLRVPGGSIYGFLGPNGAGKSTTLKMLLGLVKPTAGNITILGKEVTPKNRLGILSSTGSLIESPAYYGHLSGKENLQIICTLKNLRKQRSQGPADCTHERSAEQKSQPVFPWHETASRPGRRSSGKSEDPSSGRTHQRPGSCRHPGKCGN